MDALFVGLVLFVALLPLAYLVLVILSPKASEKATASELTYRTAKCPAESISLPSIDGPSSVDLSVIVPAFNETERLQPMIEEAVEHLSTIKNRSYEILVIDDCSTDGTSNTALRIAAGYPNADIRVVRLEKNKMKGGAIKHGVLHCRGAKILFADADGASRFSDIESLLEKLEEIEENGHGVAVGSRAHLVKTDAVVKRTFFRNFLMRGFHLLLKTLGVGFIRDTQCGFKLFTRDSARELFHSLHILGWAFDVELLVLSEILRIPVIEVAVEWHEIPGSKVNLALASPIMAKDLVILRANYTIGRWKPQTSLSKKSN
ncbi:dolichyl-phosphate beta-glucosyltransferase [Tulasnella sp. 418]|nr:dolichyl-phosphate beta-glucosyltransferase [Tulasnella sp. 418]